MVGAINLTQMKLTGSIFPLASIACFLSFVGCAGLREKLLNDQQVEAAPKLDDAKNHIRLPAYVFIGTQNWNLLMQLYVNPFIFVTSMELNLVDFKRYSGLGIDFGLKLTFEELDSFKRVYSEPTQLKLAIQRIKADFMSKTGHKLKRCMWDIYFCEKIKRAFAQEEISMYEIPKWTHNESGELCFKTKRRRRFINANSTNQIRQFASYYSSKANASTGRDSGIPKILSAPRKINPEKTESDDCIIC